MILSPPQGFRKKPWRLLTPLSLLLLSHAQNAETKLHARMVAQFVDRSSECKSVARAFSSLGAPGILSSNIHRKINLFSRGIDPHQTGQWLAANASDQVQLVILLGRHYANMHFTVPWTPDNFYVEESALHAAVWHTVVSRLPTTGDFSSALWELSRQMCDPQTSLAFDQCMHGIGHAAFYASVFRAGLMRQDEYSACAAFPSELFPMPIVLALASSACDGSSSASKQTLCLHGAYHAATLLGNWGMAHFVASLTGKNGTHEDPLYRDGPLFRYPWNHFFSPFLEEPFDAPKLSSVQQLSASREDEFIVNATVNLLMGKARDCRKYAKHTNICLSEVSCFTC